MNDAQGPRLVLASGSPRRHELLAALGATFTAIVTDAEEADDVPPDEVTGALPVAAVQLRDHPTLRAWRKAQAAALRAPDAVVLGADTIVVLDGEVLNKPVDEADARAMLGRLAGRRHTVYTGLCVIMGGEGLRPGADASAAAPARGAEDAHAARRLRLELVTAEVKFSALGEKEIAAYVATGEPLDKAGAYGLQGAGGRLVREVRGSYTAVVGLPLGATYRMLTAAGITGLADPTATYQRWLRSQGKEPLPWPPTLP